MNTKRGFTLMELMICVAIIGILAAIVMPHILNRKPAKEQMSDFVNSLYQPTGEVRISCATRRCTAVFTDRQEREKTVVADCGIDGCVAVVPADR